VRVWLEGPPPPFFFSPFLAESMRLEDDDFVAPSSVNGLKGKEHFFRFADEEADLLFLGWFFFSLLVVLGFFFFFFLVLRSAVLCVE